jgi:hypothetical protein
MRKFIPFLGLVLVCLFVKFSAVDAQYVSTNAVYWEDLRFPAAVQGLPGGAGNIVVDEVEVGADFQTDAQIATDWIYFNAQMPHSYQFGSNIVMHVHWVQTEDEVPHWMIDYRCYDIGEDPTAGFTRVIWNSSEFTYSAGTIHQLTEFAAFDPGFNNVSGMCDIKLYRDTDNDSTEFGGADPFSTDVMLKEFDIHYASDTIGSYGEDSKH